MWCAVMCCDTSLHKLKLFFSPRGREFKCSQILALGRSAGLTLTHLWLQWSPPRGDTFMPAMWAALSFPGPRKWPHKKPGAHKQTAMPSPHPGCQAPDNTHRSTRWNQLMSQPKRLVRGYTYFISYFSDQVHSIHLRYLLYTKLPVSQD